MMGNCPVCKTEGFADKRPTQFDGDLIECLRCGKYHVSRSISITLERNNHVYHTLCSWIREQNSYGNIPTLLSHDYDSLTSIPDKTIQVKYEKFLTYLSKKGQTSFYEQSILFPEMNLELLGATWSKDENSLKKLIKKGISSGHLDVIDKDKTTNNFMTFELSFDGIEFVESLGLEVNSNKIFMAFHFTDEMKKQFESTIRRAVADASDNKLEAVRVSSSSTDHDTKIDDELIGMLKSSKAVIADFTGQRNAVYYEAGYAMGLGIPVIWTCRSDNMDKLSFDTRQYPHIEWKDKEDLYEQVVNRLKAKIL